jgi:hypothetical protein
MECVPHDVSGNYAQNSLSDNYVYYPLRSFNNDPHAKNYSNCDVLGSFYTVGNTSPKDISGNTVWDIYNKKIKEFALDMSGNKLNIVYHNDISGNIQYTYSNDISGNKIKVTYNKDIAYSNKDISGNRIK